MARAGTSACAGTTEEASFPPVAPDREGLLSLNAPLCLVIEGQFRALTRGSPQGRRVLPGTAVSGHSSDLMGLEATEDSSVLIAELEDVRQAVAEGCQNRQTVLAELRGNRPPALWSVELMDHLALFLRNLPFFEDHELGLLRRLGRVMRFKVV
ncbi:unnamed protein product, partial [Polarella glacialis]